ncbi:MAG: 3-dehydroquinate synthase [Chitinophagales bacterium]|nr:3-dehydroquinate synthase [Chitinophagales bacterium]MDW8274657.1 3-dehydroquinate synthase [Chitinophagales bacterium]
MDNVFFADKLYTNLLSSGRKTFVLADSNTVRFCLPEIEKNDPVELIEIPPGETYKSLETLSFIWEALARKFANRNSILVNIGGGVVCDLGGFAASTYMRGISFIHVPTTLLAMADAAHGGKTGIDFRGIKNLIGTFSAPEKIFIYPGFLRTLPEREFLSGLAEVIKHFIVSDAAAFFEFKNNFHQHALTSLSWKEIIRRAIQIKYRITSADPLEKGIRKILNFGHTVGHAIESLFLKSTQPLLHGEAVALGMIIETIIAREERILTAKDADIIIGLLIDIYQKRPRIHDAQEWLSLMLHDKKNINSAIYLSLPNRIGNCLFNVEVSEKSLFHALTIYHQLYANT